MASAFGSPRRHRFSREEYYAMADRGQFRDSRVELLRGEIIDMSPQHARHAALVNAAQEAIAAAFGVGHAVRVQLPMSIAADSEPEPDVAVVRGRPRDYLNAHPTTALLVVELADSSLAYDRGEKATLYSEAGIPEYWVVDLVSGKLYVYRDPGPAGYRSVDAMSPGQTIRPLLAPASNPGAAVEIAALLP